jgi:hypothetical protein
MQPLSRVKPDATVTWGALDTMTSRPAIAVKIAECIAEWADTETIIGLMLAILLDTDPDAALAIYSAVDSRSAQNKMILGAAKSKLPSEQYDLLTVTLKLAVTPVMKERDRYAHWCWAYSPEIPDALILSQPDHKMVLHHQAVNLARLGKSEVPFDASKLFVVKEADASRLANRMRAAKDNLTSFMAAIWNKNSQQVRDEYFQRLSTEPQIREGLIRLREGRQENQATQQPKPPRDQIGES